MSAVVEQPIQTAVPHPLLEKRIQELPGVRQVVQILFLAVAIAGGLWLFFWTQKPTYSTLFSGLADADAAEIAEALRAANIPFSVEAGRGLVLVPEEHLNQARLQLAAQGLPAGGRAGFEMIEGEQGFGVSQFVEGARYQMALETELARTIGTLRPVKDARVHLALPKPSAFTRAQEPSAASVLLQLYPGTQLNTNQVAAIVHLVATSIPNLDPGRITVIDQSGRMLTVPDPNSDEAISDRQFEQVQRLQADYSARIARLLEPLTGPGRVSAQVSIDMDFSVIEEARETFSPDPKLRSEQMSEESSNATAEGPQGVGATPNTPPTGPPTQGGAAPQQGTSQAARTATRNFEIDRTLSHSKQSVGRVKRVTAAVLVDHLPGPADAEGNPTTRPLDEAEIERIQSLVREAIGFDAARGDSVSVVNAGFAKPEPLAELPAQPIWKVWEQPKFPEYLRLAIGALGLLLVYRLLRPTLTQIANPAPPALPAGQEEEQTDDEDADALEHEGVEGQAKDALPSPQEEALGILAGPGSYEQRLSVARAAVQQDPKRVAQVVRTWVNIDG